MESGQNGTHKNEVSTENLLDESSDSLSQVLSQMSIDETRCSAVYNFNRITSPQADCSNSVSIDVNGIDAAEHMVLSGVSFDSGSDSDSFMRKRGHVYTGPLDDFESEEDHDIICSTMEEKTNGNPRKKMRTTSETVVDSPQKLKSPVKKNVASSSKTQPFEISPSQLLPISAGKKSKRKETSRKGTSGILTNSPYYRELREKNPAASITTDDDASCLFCGGLYSKSKESWIRCNSCEKWAHYSCAHADDNLIEYVCDNCADKN